MKESIPKEVLLILETLQSSEFDGYLVGGCVRDLIIGKTPKDWDITTNAIPEEIQKVFPDSFYENDFGTVGVKTRSDDPTYSVVEITPYRTETTYSDNRHPDEVSFSETIEEYLSRRDFTMNAIAYDPIKDNLIDLYNGKEDISKGVINTVGNASERFKEDSLRILRAIRFASELSFTISSDIVNAISDNSSLLNNVSRERIGEEFKKMILSNNPVLGLSLAQKLDITDYFTPVLRETFGVEQNKQAHKYDVWEHLLHSLEHAANKEYSLELRLAALFHDIGKPRSKREDKTGKTTFFGHEVIGANMTKKVLEDLKFSRETIKKVVKLVRWHMFFSDTDEITLSAVRRLIANVGKEDIWDLIDIRKCDRIGSGRPKEEPYRLRKFEAMIDQVISDPISVSMLKMNGDIMLEMFHVKPGRHIGWVLHALLEDVLDDPTRNNNDYLNKRTKELLELPHEELEKLGKSGKDKQEIEESNQLREIKRKHKV